MDPRKNPPSATDQAAKIAAAYRAVPKQDSEAYRFEEDIQNSDLDRAFDEIVRSRGTGRPTGEAGEDAGSQYECLECGQVNPGINQFCGGCGAAHGETVAAPARRITDEGSVPLHLSAINGTRHHHHYFHHNHYRSTPYLVVMVVILLAVIAWQAGWNYGLRIGVPPATLHETQPSPAISTPQAPEAREAMTETPAAVQTNPTLPQVSQDNPYPNELQGFKFYPKDLAPLRPGISPRPVVVRVLGDETKVVGGWSIIPAYTNKPGSGGNPALGRLLEVVIRPGGVIPMSAVRFPAATFAHCPAVLTGIGVSFDVYSDASGLEYWLYGEDSKWGRKGDLYRIVYGAGKRHC